MVGAARGRQELAAGAGRAWAPSPVPPGLPQSRGRGREGPELQPSTPRLLAVDDAALILFSITSLVLLLCPSTGPAVRHPELLVVGGGGPLTGPAAPVVPASREAGWWAEHPLQYCLGGPLGPPSRPGSSCAIVAREPEGAGGERARRGGGQASLKSGTPAHPSGWSDEAPSLCGALIGKILLGGRKPRLLWVNRRAGG